MPRLKKKLNERQLELLESIANDHRDKDANSHNRLVFQRFNKVYLNQIRINELNQQARTEKDQNKAYEMLQIAQKLQDENDVNIQYGNDTFTKMIRENENFDRVFYQDVFEWFNDYLDTAFNVEEYIGDNKVHMFDLSINNVLDVYHEKLETFKSLFDRPANTSFIGMHQAPLENSFLERIQRFNDKNKNKILNTNPKDKDIITKFSLSLSTNELKQYVDNLNEKVFMPITDNGKTTYNKLDKDSIKFYANKIKDLQAIIDARPFWKTWFNDKHKADLAEIKRAKQALVDIGVDKKALDKYLSASPKKAEAKFNELIAKSENAITEFNKNNSHAAIKPNVDAKRKEQLNIEADELLNNKLVDNNIDLDVELDNINLNNEFDVLKDDSTDSKLVDNNFGIDKESDIFNQIEQPCNLEDNLFGDNEDANVLKDLEKKENNKKLNDSMESSFSIDDDSIEKNK